MNQLKIGTSWVRGVVGDGLTPELVVNFACAFGTWADGGPVVIGNDPRRSSTMMRAAVIAGLLSPGCEIVDLGLCPTPLISFAVRELGTAGGISITGSHNDARWNALKFLGPDGMLLNPIKSEELLDIYHASAFLTAHRDRLQAPGGAPGVTERYLEHILSALDVEAIRARGFRIALDFTNGSCAPIARRLLGELGCELIPLNEEPTGMFAHPPAPCIANMRELARLVKVREAQLGAAINVDGDRVAFVTAAGEGLSEEYTLPLAALNRLARRPGTIVTSLSTSRMVEALAERKGLKLVRTLVGESFVMERGLEEDAVLAGEGCGGVASIPATMTFDGLLTIGMVLETMALSDRDLAGLVADLPRFVMRKGELACPPDQVVRILESFRSRFGQAADCTDGVRYDWDDAWLHVRASNTEPLVRVIVEAQSESRAAALYKEAMACAWRMASADRE